jgi:hypothetical protein
MHNSAVFLHRYGSLTMVKVVLLVNAGGKQICEIFVVGGGVLGFIRMEIRRDRKRLKEIRGEMNSRPLYQPYVLAKNVGMKSF